jgi:hypothetical protein
MKSCSETENLAFVDVKDNVGVHWKCYINHVDESSRKGVYPGWKVYFIVTEYECGFIAYRPSQVPFALRLFPTQSFSTGLAIRDIGRVWVEFKLDNKINILVFGGKAWLVTENSNAIYSCFNRKFKQDVLGCIDGVASKIPVKLWTRIKMVCSHLACTPSKMSTKEVINAMKTAMLAYLNGSAVHNARSINNFCDSSPHPP